MAYIKKPCKSMVDFMVDPTSTSEFPKRISGCHQLIPVHDPKGGGKSVVVILEVVVERLAGSLKPSQFLTQDKTSI